MYEFSEGCFERPRKDGDISLPFPRGTCIIHSPATLLPDSELEKQSVERNSRVQTELPESRIRLAFLRKSIIFFGVLHRGGPKIVRWYPPLRERYRRWGKNRWTWPESVSTVKGVQMRPDFPQVSRALPHSIMVVPGCLIRRSTRRCGREARGNKTPDVGGNKGSPRPSPWHPCSFLRLASPSFA